MGTVFRKTYTKPLPPNAEISEKNGRRVAKWQNSKGKIQRAPITQGQDGEDRLSLRARVYSAKFRDGTGLVRTVTTGCKDEMAARQVLAELERQAELVKAGVVKPEEAEVSRHQEALFEEHLDAYEDSLKAKSVTDSHRQGVMGYLRRLSLECSIGRLSDLTSTVIEKWLGEQAEQGRSSRSRNVHRSAAVAFGNWCVKTRRLLINPLEGLPTASEKADPRRQRRAFSVSELEKLLHVTSQRPLAEFGRVPVSLETAPKRKTRKGKWTYEPLTLEDLAPAADRARERFADKPAKVAELERLGVERALIYKMLALTGLRKGELASLTVSNLSLTGDLSFATLEAANEKNREGNTIPIRRDLSNDIQNWLNTKLKVLQDARRVRGSSVPDALPGNTPVFEVPDKLIKILNRDLEVARIPKRDDRKRTVDVHSFRHTFATLLSSGGVPLRTAQAALRHSDPKLTANVYTDPRLLDVHGALDALPELELEGFEGKPRKEAEPGSSEPASSSQLAPQLAPTPDVLVQAESSGVGEGVKAEREVNEGGSTVSDAAVDSSDHESADDSWMQWWAMLDSNPATPCL